MISEGRRDEYEKHLLPALEKQATDNQSRRVVTAMKRRIAGGEWRPSLPSDFTYFIITLVEQQLAFFLENREERADQSPERFESD
jgi:hypothetical protein